VWGPEFKHQFCSPLKETERKKIFEKTLHKNEKCQKGDTIERENIREYVALHQASKFEWYLNRNHNLIENSTTKNNFRQESSIGTVLWIQWDEDGILHSLKYFPTVSLQRG
jgi:hypothetical protein